MISSHWRFVKCLVACFPVLSFSHADVSTSVLLLMLSPGKKKMSLYDSQAPICPICQVLLRPGELQEHMETEIERLASICLR